MGWLPGFPIFGRWFPGFFMNLCDSPWLMNRDLQFSIEVFKIFTCPSKFVRTYQIWQVKSKWRLQIFTGKLILCICIGVSLCDLFETFKGNDDPGFPKHHLKRPYFWKSVKMLEKTHGTGNSGKIEREGDRTALRAAALTRRGAWTKHAPSWSPTPPLARREGAKH